MSAEQDDKLDKILNQVEKINRGLYGDSDNKVKGLMQEHYELKDDVIKLKESQKKKAWLIAGFTSAASFSVPWLIEWFKKHFGG